MSWIPDFSKTRTDPSKRNSSSALGTLSLHHSHAGGAPFDAFLTAPFPKLGLISVPSRSKAATFDEHTGVRFVPWRQLPRAPRGFCHWNVPVVLGSLGELLKKGWTARYHEPGVNTVSSKHVPFTTLGPLEPSIDEASSSAAGRFFDNVEGPEAVRNFRWEKREKGRRNWPAWRAEDMILIVIAERVKENRGTRVVLYALSLSSSFPIS